MRLHTLTLIAGVCVAAPAHAAIAFSNFSPSYTYVTSTGWDMNYSGWNSAMRFTSISTGVIDQIKVSAFLHTGATFKLKLFSDSGGLIGSLIDTWTISPSTLTGSPVQVVTNTGSASVVLGTNYWLFAENTSPGTGGVWWHPTQINPSGLVASTSNHGSSWSYSSGRQAGFELTTAGAVPEPFSAGLVGLSALAYIRRRIVKR